MFIDFHRLCSLPRSGHLEIQHIKASHTCLSFQALPWKRFSHLFSNFTGRLNFIVVKYLLPILQLLQYLLSFPVVYIDHSCTVRRAPHRELWKGRQIKQLLFFGRCSAEPTTHSRLPLLLSWESGPTSQRETEGNTLRKEKGAFYSGALNKR